MLWAVAVLLAALPAALAFVPVAPLLARSRGREVGVHLDDLATIARGARVDTVLLDRWGTVTTGALRVVGVEPVEPDHERNLRWFAGALGHAADDPVGRAIARLAGRGRLSRVEHHPGGALTGSVDRHPVRLGRPDRLGLPARPAADHGDGVGVTVGVEVDGRALGWITVGDDVRAHAAEAADALRADGVEPVLVSDDTEAGTEHLARTCRIARWHARVPAEKRDTVVTEHRAEGRVVALAAGTEDPCGADLLFSDRDGAAGLPDAIRLDDLDLTRIRAALALSRRAVARQLLGRRAGVVLALVGVGLAAAGVLGLAAATGYGVVASLVVAGLAARP